MKFFRMILNRRNKSDEEDVYQNNEPKSDKKCSLDQYSSLGRCFSRRVKFQQTIKSSRMTQSHTTTFDPLTESHVYHEVDPIEESPEGHHLYSNLPNPIPVQLLSPKLPQSYSFSNDTSPLFSQNISQMKHTHSYQHHMLKMINHNYPYNQEIYESPSNKYHYIQMPQRISGRPGIRTNPWLLSPNTQNSENDLRLYSTRPNNLSMQIYHQKSLTSNVFNTPTDSGMSSQDKTPSTSDPGGHLRSFSQDVLSRDEIEPPPSPAPPLTNSRSINIMQITQIDEDQKEKCGKKSKKLRRRKTHAGFSIKTSDNALQKPAVDELDRRLIQLGKVMSSNLHQIKQSRFELYRTIAMEDYENDERLHCYQNLTNMLNLYTNLLSVTQKTINEQMRNYIKDLGRSQNKTGFCQFRIAEEPEIII